MSLRKFLVRIRQYERNPQYDEEIAMLRSTPPETRATMRAPNEFCEIGEIELKLTEAQFLQMQKFLLSIL